MVKSKKNNKKRVKKHITKKKLKGGMGYVSKYWNTHPKFKEINNRLKHTVVLSSTNNLSDPNHSQYGLYSPLLDNLLTIRDGIINMDFISDFFRNIHYDLEGTFGISDGKWNNERENKYNIERYFTQAHGNTSIFFLKKKENTQSNNRSASAYTIPEPEYLVLKVFNNINFEENIKDYLSLVVSEINSGSSSFNLSFQNNYLFFSENFFKITNFNMDNNFIESNIDGSKLYLSVKNNDAINDYIINLILQKINETTPFNFVKYHNLFVTRINGQFKYCILMDKLDGSLDNAIKQLNPDNPVNDGILHTVFKQIEKDLNTLKTKNYLFTHTDMKVENIFYKDNPDGTITPYLADFDKSSITFHNIRFHNDIGKAAGLKSYADPTSFLGGLMKDMYTYLGSEERQKLFNTRTKSVNEAAANENTSLYANAPANITYNGQVNSGRDVKYNYRLSRVGRTVMPKTGIQGIETEQTYMRYNITPYYTSFDMSILLCSLFNKKIFRRFDENHTPLLYNFTKEYIVEKYIKTIFDIYNTSTLTDPGNFGLLTGLLLNRDDLPDGYFIHNFNFERPNPFINKLYKTINNKIALTIPFCPITFSYSNKSPLTNNSTATDKSGYLSRIVSGFVDASKKMVFTNEISSFKLNPGLTDRLYNSSDIKNPKIKQFFDALNNSDFIVEYNIDYVPGVGGIRTPPPIIVKTNRYSYTSATTKVYDYDEVGKDFVKQAIDFFISIKNK
jgi:hypothetical protein